MYSNDIIDKLKKELLFYYTNLAVNITPENTNQWIEEQVQANIQNLDNAITTYKNINECIKQLKIYCELNYPNTTEEEVKNFISKQLQNQDSIGLAKIYEEINLEKLDELQQQEIHKINELRVKYGLSYKIYVQGSVFSPEGKPIAESIKFKLNYYNNNKQQYKCYLDYENVLNDYFKHFNIQGPELSNTVSLKMQEILNDNNFVIPKYEHNENDIEQIVYNISEKYQNLIKFSNFLKQDENIGINIYYQTCANTGLTLDSLMYHDIENWEEYFLFLGSLDLNEQQKQNVISNVINVHFINYDEKLKNLIEFGEEIKKYGKNIAQYDINECCKYIVELSKKYTISTHKLFDIFKEGIKCSNINKYNKDFLCEQLNTIYINRIIKGQNILILQPLQIKTEEIATIIEQKDTIIEQQKKEILSLQLLRKNSYTINKEYNKIFNNCENNRDFFEKLGEYSNKNVFVKNNNYIQNETVKNFLLKDNKKYFYVKTLEEAYKQGVQKIKIGIHK